MSPRYDVFLSHSSADKPAVEELARKLRAAGFEPFLDKWHLVPGEPWQEALEQALDESRTCAVLIGPKGVGPWQNEEMRSALEDRVRDQAFRVIPVLLPGALESQKEKLPRFLRRLFWVDFRVGLDDQDALHRLVSGIQGIALGPSGRGERPASSSFYRSMAQPPEAFIHRQEYDKVLEALCSPSGIVLFTSVGTTTTLRGASGFGKTDLVTSVGITTTLRGASGFGKTDLVTSVGIITALRGAGGFGKTALAQAICQDPRVRQTYPDGILWTTMGEDIDDHGRLARVRDLIRWWTREEAPAFETLSIAGARLRELLAHSRVLIVIDDVWSSADVTPFQGLSKGSALLITTRGSQTLPADSKRVEVDAMEPAEAISLLGLGLPDGSSQEFQSLAARLGEWPLLLKLVNRQLQELVKEDGLTVPKALREIEEALESEGFSAFDLDDRDSRHAASRAILVSVRRLPEKERELYFQLAVFPEDAHIPLSVLERFWELGHVQVRKFCRRLYDLSLLLEFDSEGGVIRLHNVIRRVLAEQIGKALPSLHGRLLDGFRPASGAWPDLPAKESYVWWNLSYHFLGAERRDDFRRLLFDFSFLKAKLEATDVNALIADYEGFAGEEKELRLIYDTLRLSEHVLARDLYGRLSGFQVRDLRLFLEAALPEFCLRPRQANLTRQGGPLIRTLEGHSGGVSSVAVMDSRRAVSSSGDRTLRVWDLETGETLRTLEGHVGEVSSVAVVDRRRAISSSSDGTLRVWDLETGETLRTLEGRSGWLSAVAVVDGRRAVSGSGDGTLRVWDFETGKALRTLEGHPNRVGAVAMVDGRRAVSASDDRTLRVWDLETGETLRTLEGHLDWVRTVAVVEGHRAVSGSHDRTLRVWDLETDETFREGHSR